jgi:hypothetical protein
MQPQVTNEDFIFKTICWNSRLNTVNEVSLSKNDTQLLNTQLLGITEQWQLNG